MGHQPGGLGHRRHRRLERPQDGSGARSFAAGSFSRGGSVITIVAVVVTLVLVKAGSGPGTASASSEDPTGTAPHGLVPDVSSVPASVLDAVGEGNLASDALARVSGPALTSEGEPELLYVGANFCPFCAAERWPMIIVLSRFGTFSGLSTTRSSTTDEYPGTATLITC
jgi:hypothetical protein